MPSHWFHRIADRSRGHRATLLAALIFPMMFSFLRWQMGPQPRATLPPDLARILEFSPDGRRMFAGGATEAAILNVATGRILVKIATDVHFPTSAGTPFSWPRFTPDGAKLIFEIQGPRLANGQCLVELKVVDAGTGRERASFPRVGGNDLWGPGDRFPEYALSADGSTLAFVREPGGKDSEVVIWDLSRGAEISSFPGAPPLALSPDGQSLAYRPLAPGPSRFAIRPVTADAPSVAFEPMRPERGTDRQTAAAFSPDGRSLVVGGAQGSEIRDAATGQLQDLLQSVKSPRAIGFGPDSHSLSFQQEAPGGPLNNIELWTNEDSTWQRRFNAPANQVSATGHRYIPTFHPPRSRRDFPPSYNTTIKIIDPEDQREVGKFTGANVHQISLSPDGRTVAVLSIGQEMIHPSPVVQFFDSLFPERTQEDARSLESGKIEIHDILTGQTLTAIDRTTSDRSRTSLSFSPDGQTLVVRQADHPVELWDRSPSRPIAQIAAISALATAFALGAGGWIDRRRAARKQPARSLKLAPGNLDLSPDYPAGLA